MDSKQIASLISEAAELERKTTELAMRLAVIKALLINEAGVALGLVTPELQDARRSKGLSHSFQDEIGQTATISFPRDQVIGTFWFRKEQGREVAYRYKQDKLLELGPLKDDELAGAHFRDLFFPMFKPQKGFVEILPVALKRCPKRMERLLDLCTEPSSPRCSIKSKDASAPARARELALV